jgi:hypothetical protein
MKHLITYEDFTYSLENNINEFEFLNWLLHSGEVKNKSKQIATLRFTIRKRELEIKNKNIEQGEDPNMMTEQEIVELKSYEDEATNLEQQIQHKYGASEYLTKLSQSVILSEENRRIKELRKIATKEDRSKLDQVSRINTQQNTLLNQQLNMAKKYKGDFNAMDYKKKKEIEKRDINLKQLENEKLRLQNEEIKRRAELFGAKTQSEKVKNRQDTMMNIDTQDVSMY